MESGSVGARRGGTSEDVQNGTWVGILNWRGLGLSVAKR